MTTPFTSALPMGSTLCSGKYIIENVLGQGSFGITYLARRRGENRRVAIKEFFMADRNGRMGSTVTCSSSDGMYEKYKEKFGKEAQKLQKLSHEHIIKVHNSFEENGTAYYAMEYISGGSLDQYLQQHGPMSEQEAIVCARQIGEALSYMHGLKMLHLDLKPGNIMRRNDGTLILIDFGLAKQYDEKGEPESSTTIGGGTPGYAPLEQSHFHEGSSFSTTMDIYAFGATLFKALTGRRPPEAADLMNDGFPADELQNRGVSRALIAVIRKAMEPKKADRYKTIEEMVKALPDIEPEVIVINKPTDEKPKEEEHKTVTGTGTSQREKARETSDRTGQKVASWVIFGIAAIIGAMIIGDDLWDSILCIGGMVIIAELIGWLTIVLFGGIFNLNLRRGVLCTICYALSAFLAYVAYEKAGVSGWDNLGAENFLYSAVLAAGVPTYFISIWDKEGDS